MALESIFTILSRIKHPTTILAIMVGGILFLTYNTLSTMGDDEEKGMLLLTITMMLLMVIGFPLVIIISRRMR